MKKKYLIVLVFSLSINFLCILPYAIQKINDNNSEYFKSTSSDKEVIEAVATASLKIKKSHMKQQEFRGLVYDVYSLFKPKRNSEITNNYYMAYNYAGLSEYIIKQNNRNTIQNLIHKADSFIEVSGKLNYPLTRIDQCPIGILYLNLYKHTKQEKYLNVAKNLFEFLKAKRTDGNIITYRDNDKNFSDAVGMFVPFLMDYYEITGDTLSKNIAIDNIKHFKKYGIDSQTGIPFHGYDIKTGIKLGSCNWGRGIGWYLLAISYCQEENDSLLYSSIQKLPYTQFPFSSNNFDSSTALMFEIYKQSTDKSRSLNLDFIRTHIAKSGLVSDCSGDTYNFNHYSSRFGENELCNGLLLLLYSRFNNLPVK